MNTRMTATGYEVMIGAQLIGVYDSIETAIGAAVLAVIGASAHDTVLATVWLGTRNPVSVQIDETGTITVQCD